MANAENLKGKGFDNRSTSELREIQSRGGKRSGETRRRKADFKKSLNLLLTAEVTNDWTPILVSLGLESTLETAMLMSMVKRAIAGDVKAARFVAEYSGQADKTDADLEEQRIRTDRAKRARDMEVGEEDLGDENIQNFLKAMRPTPEEMADLFVEESDDEEAEETGKV